MGTLKGRTAIRVFTEFPDLKEKPYWGNHFWARGYCVDTVGLDAEMIRKHVKYQESKERRRRTNQIYILNDAQGTTEACLLWRQASAPF